MTDQATREKELRTSLLAMMQRGLRGVKHGGKGARIREVLREYSGGILDPKLRAELGPVSPSQYYCWKKRAKKGLNGLAVKKGRPKGSTNMPEDQAEYILGLVAQKPHRRPARIAEYVKARFDGAAVSEATVRRFLKRWEREQRQLYQWMRDPDKWKGCFMAAFGSACQRAEYFLHAVEFDTTPADVRCSDGMRYKVIGGIDVFSRKPWVLLSQHSTGIAIATLWRKVITEAGVFDVAVMDNGKEYRSHHIESAALSLGIDLPELPHFAPERKPHIERFLRTLAYGLFEELDGYTGHNVAEAQALRNQKSFAERFMTRGEVVELNLTAEELQAKVDKWIQVLYNQRRHRELGKSPEQKAAESARPIRTISNERALDILLAPGGRGTVQKKGVRFRSGTYAAVELIGAIRKKVDVKLDLVDASKVYVFAAEPCERWERASGEWQDCREGDFICVARDASLEGLSVEEARDARKAQLKRMREQHQAMKTLAADVGDPMGELLDEKARQPGKVVALHQKMEVATPEIAAAEEAAASMEHGAWSKEDEVGFTEEHSGEPIFEYGYQRYEYLTAKAEPTEAENNWLEWYRETEEYFEIFGIELEA